MVPPESRSPAVARRRWIVQGLVQGVGFRPFVRRLALRFGLGGFVYNDSRGVVIEGEGEPSALDGFAEGLRIFAPPLAVIASIASEELDPACQREFHILPSATRAEARAALIPPDVATCDACRAELRDPADRRYRYPFVNCTDCGPRYTIVEGLPYDRAQTTMRAFALCEECRREYEDPNDRRYHAQPNACPRCGPRVWLADSEGRALPVADPIHAAATALAQGEILAVKGIGGFHLACDAAAAVAVARLRRRKGRPDKPLAVMVRDLETADRVALLSPREREILVDWRRPILLGTPRRPTPIVPGVFGTSRLVGLLLPYSPLHHLLLDAGPPILVMTSGNRSDEPIARENAEACTRLGEIADRFLLHDREIGQAADDSIARVMRGRPVLLRRSRGYVPQPLILPVKGPPVLALGADLKGTCAVTRDGLAFLGPYLGDLAHPAAAESLERSAEHLMRLLGVRPALIVHDLHPDYASTRIAERLAGRLEVEQLGVQHHQAHALALLAEHGVGDPALAVAFDGAGLGTDGTIWGGEFLRMTGPQMARVAHFAPIRMPGGDRAAREPWRMAVALLRRLGGEAPPGLACLAELDPATTTAVWTLADPAGDAPLTSSVGRLFDAAASLLGIRQRLSYEGQAATELEEAASESGATGSYPFSLQEPPGDVAGGATRGGAAGPTAGAAAATIDPAEIFDALLRDRASGTSVADCARRFHRTLAAVVGAVARRERRRHGIETVALTGGVFQNRLLVDAVVEELAPERFRVLLHAQVSPNDEGVALGQAWAGTLHLSG